MSTPLREALNFHGMNGWTRTCKAPKVVPSLPSQVHAQLEIASTDKISEVLRTPFLLFLSTLRSPFLGVISQEMVSVSSSHLRRQRARTGAFSAASCRAKCATSMCSWSVRSSWTLRKDERWDKARLGTLMLLLTKPLGFLL